MPTAPAAPAAPIAPAAPAAPNAPAAPAVPAVSYRVNNPIPPRTQWNANYGYCGETSFISAGLNYGQYLSQYDARAVASPNIRQSLPDSQLLLGVNDVAAAKRSYFTSLFPLNPSGIVPIGGGGEAASAAASWQEGEAAAALAGKRGSSAAVEDVFWLR